jgi:hypothetical protein
MRPIDHFFSQLERSPFGGHGRGPSLDSRAADYLSGEFISLTAPVIGAAAAKDIFARSLERIEKAAGGAARAPDGGLVKLGCIAAFFLGEYDDHTMKLNKDDWEDIRETLEEVSSEIGMNTLTALMGALLEKGKLG